MQLAVQSLSDQIGLADLQRHVLHAHVGGVLHQRPHQRFADALAPAAFRHRYVGDVPFVQNQPRSGVAQYRAVFFRHDVAGAGVAGHFLLKALQAPRLRKGFHFDGMDRLGVGQGHAAIDYAHVFPSAASLAARARSACGARR